MKIGFTGTRLGLTNRQLSTLAFYMSKAGISEGHHGLCVGADEAFHGFASQLGWRIVGHPGTDLKWRANLDGFSTCWTPRPNLARNADILSETEWLFACPEGPERLRSGTWSTVRKARKLGRPITIIWPDGSVTRENQ